MKKLNENQENAIRWHLQNNFIPSCSPKLVDGIIDVVNECRLGLLSPEDTISVNDHAINIGEMIQDFRLEDYIFESAI